jgi:hypothetical protein
LGAKTEVICKHASEVEAVNNIACDCFNDLSDTCVAATSVAVSQARPCPGESFEVTYLQSSVQGNSSVLSNLCTNVFLYAYSVAQFKEEPLTTLASNIVPIAQPDPYSVYNSKGAVVGLAIGDGIEVKLDQILPYYNVCFTTTNPITAPSSEYSIYDAATPDPKQTSRLIPLSATVYPTTYGFCAEIIAPSSDSSYFPIMRLNGNWESKDKQIHTHTETALLYVLAVLFLIAALLTALSFVFFIIASDAVRIQLLVTMIFTFLFTLSKYYHHPIYLSI